MPCRCLYDPSQVGSSLVLEQVASNGSLYLGSYNGSAWVNAVQGNDSTGLAALADYQGSWAEFTAAEGLGTSHTLAQLLGSWGVDTVQNTVWAVIDHSGAEFAVVPEPCTLALLAAGGIGLLGCLGAGG